MGPSAILSGRRILLPRRPDGHLAAGLRAAGAAVDEVDLVSRVPVPGEHVERLVTDLAAGRFDWLVLTSAFTVEALARLGHRLPGLIGPGTRLAAVGDATAAAARSAGCRVDLVPAHGAGGLALAAGWPAGPGRVAIPGAVASARTLPRALRERGWEVVQTGVYQTSPAGSVPPAIGQAWAGGDYDVLVVTAGSVVRAAAGLLGTGVAAVAVGAASARTARLLGFAPVVTAASPATADVVAAAALACAG